jgi:amidase
MLLPETAVPGHAASQADDCGAFLPGERCLRLPTGHGLLDGLVFGVKDLIDVAGTVTGGGNPDWAATHAPAARDAACVQLLRRAGATVVGKTVTDELAFSLEGENAHYGTPRNPHAPGRLPGGSSSGSAAATAAGLVDFALGTDTGGSVRVPASFCGLYGMRPTHGRVPLDGVLPFAPSYDTVGWFAREAQTLHRVGSVLLGAGGAGGAHRAPWRLKLQVARDVFELADSRSALRLLPLAQDLGARSVVGAFEGTPADWLRAYQVLQGDEILASLGAWIKRTRPRFGDNIAPRFAGLAAIRGEEVAHWRSWRDRQAARLRAAIAPDEAWVLPTTPGIALARDASGEERGRFYDVALAINAIAGHAGLPQVTLPYTEVDGLPVGLSLVGAPHSDESLLAFATLHA